MEASAVLQNSRQINKDEDSDAKASTSRNASKKVSWSHINRQDEESDEYLSSLDEESIRGLLNADDSARASDETSLSSLEPNETECEKCGHMRGFANNQPCCSFCVQWYIKPIVCITCNRKFVLQSSYKRHCEDHEIANHAINCAQCRDKCRTCLHYGGDGYQSTEGDEEEDVEVSK